MQSQPPGTSKPPSKVSTKDNPWKEWKLEGVETLTDAVRATLGNIAAVRQWPHSTHEDLYRITAALASGNGWPEEMEEFDQALKDTSLEGDNLCAALCTSMGQPALHKKSNCEQFLTNHAQEFRVINPPQAAFSPTISRTTAPSNGTTSRKVGVTPRILICIPTVLKLYAISLHRSSLT